MWYILAISFLSLFATNCGEHATDKVDLTWKESVKLLKSASENVTFTLSGALHQDALLTLNTSYSSKKNISPVAYPKKVILRKNETETKMTISGTKVGQIVILIEANDENISLPDNPRLRVYVIQSHTLTIINIVIGWMYFVAWSISFYPQVYLNFKRKSVVGLNFDFLTYNITGFIAYCLYNIGLFWIPLVQQQYLKKYPDGVNPVQANDVIFTIHATFITAVTIFQCFIYERGGQKVSKLATALVTVAWIAMFILLFVAVGHKITWLTYLTIFSYLKLAVTLIKYIPQAYMNYKRKSTVGWSIGNVLLDFTGGSLSILQMMLQSYNNDEWDLIFGDPTKFGLGFFSILFDIIFIVQHYILYRQPKIQEVGLLDSDSDD